MGTSYESLPRVYNLAPANINTAGFASGVTGATWTLTANSSGDNLAHKVTVKNDTANDKSGINITLTGTDQNGQPQTETLTGPTGNATVTSAKYYLTLTSIAPASTWGADTADIGWSSAIAYATINVNYMAEDILSLVATVTGTINFTINQTFDKIDFTGTPAITPTWLAIASSQTAGGTVYQTTGGATAIQIIVNSYSNGATLKVNANATFVPNPAGAGVPVASVNVSQVGGSAVGSSLPVSAVAAASGGASYTHIAAGQATTVVKASAGTLYAIVFNGVATATNVTTVYDNASGAGTVIAIPQATLSTGLQPLTFGPAGLAFANGLTIITSTANGADMTVVWK